MYSTHDRGPYTRAVVDLENGTWTRSLFLIIVSCCAVVAVFKLFFFFVLRSTHHEWITYMDNWKRVKKRFFFLLLQVTNETLPRHPGQIVFTEIIIKTYVKKKKKKNWLLLGITQIAGWTRDDEFKIDSPPTDFCALAILHAYRL